MTSGDAPSIDITPTKLQRRIPVVMVKKSSKKPRILDFFSPVPHRPQESAKATAQLQDAITTAQGPATLASRARQQDISAPQTSLLSNAHSTLSAPTSDCAISPDARPPTASQTSATSGVSKRIVSNGELVVLDSDSDDDSLVSLDFGVAATSFKTVAPTTGSKRATHHDEDGLRKPEHKVKKKKKTQLDQVVETVQKTKELERIINERKADLENDVEDTPTTGFVLDTHALGQVIQDDDDPEKARRLYLAMQRTNATHVEHVFYLFTDTLASPIPPRFPVQSLPNRRWTTSFLDASSRDQAFMTGFAQQVFRLQDLPEELASWMIDQICLDSSDALDLKYLEILGAHPQYFRTLLHRNRLDSIFTFIGADTKVLHSNAPLAPSFTVEPAGRPSLPRPLKSICRLLERAAPFLRTKARSYALYLLYHTCLDDRISASPDILFAIQNAIEATMCHFVDNRTLMQGVGSPQSQDELESLIASQLSDVLPNLLARITHPILQRNLVCALPTESPLTAYFQRYIALSFLLHPDVVDLPLADPQMPAVIHGLLQTSPGFRISKDTDYHFLAARMTLLDIALGPGVASIPYQPLVGTAPSQPDSSPIIPPGPELDEVKFFNKEVDGLAQHIKILGNSIMEAGAVADLTILDAKDSVERLCSRLEHAVRIGGKKVHDVFSNDDEDEKQLKVTDIFRKAAKARNTAPTSDIFDQNHDFDSALAAQIASETQL